MDEQRIDELVARRRRQQYRNVRGVVELLDRRAELRGVAPMADHLAESLAWMV